MRRGLGFAGVWTALALASGACGHVDGDGRSAALGVDRAAIVGGTLDTKDPAIVMILKRASASSSDVRVICTGTIISPHVVLTAAHCVDPRVAGPGQFGVFTGDDIDGPQGSESTRFFTAKETHFDQEFDPANQPPQGGHDIGVIITSSAFSATPIPMNRSALGDDFVGATVRLVGAGVTTPDAGDTGRMNELTGHVAGLDPDHLVFEDPKQSICGGDSGGPTLLMRDGREIIVGVHSYGEHATSCTGKGYDQRIDPYVASFVIPFVTKADPKFDLVDPTPNVAVDASPPEQPELPPAAPSDAAAPATAAPSSGSDGCNLHGSSPPDQRGALIALAVAILVRRRSLLAAQRRRS